MASTVATNTRVAGTRCSTSSGPGTARADDHPRDGRPQSSPVTCGVDAEGRIVVSTYPERAKVANVRRDPRVSVCVLSDEWNGPWVQVDGTAEVLDLPDALEPLVDYFRASPASTRTGTSTARPCGARASR